jgi:hypothetical protein
MDYREKVNMAFAATRSDRLGMDGNEFMAIKVPEPNEGDTWGNWTFQKHNLTLQYRNSEGYTDEIDLERIDEILALAIWMKDLSHKTFMAPEDVGNFFIAIQDLTGAWWMPDTNVTELIRKKYGRRAA